MFVIMAQSYFVPSYVINWQPLYVNRYLFKFRLHLV